MTPKNIETPKPDISDFDLRRDSENMRNLYFRDAELVRPLNQAQAAHIGSLAVKALSH